MHIKIEIHKEQLFSMFLYCLFVVFMILVIGNKRNLHVDEVFSYGLSNHEGMDVNLQEGYTYEPAAEVWLNYMTVDRTGRFCYKNVWENQAADVHPPFYYMLLHTICSLFPGRFSIWFAGSINILSAVGTLFFVRKLALLFAGEEKLRRLFSIAFISSVGVLSAVSFLRMYIAAMFWVTALTWLLLRQFEGNGWQFYAALFLCVVGGAFTHYYCILYTVSISIAYGIILLSRKAWKETGTFCLTQALSGFVSLGCFPSMMKHVFEGYRGKEAFDNLGQGMSNEGFGRIVTYINKLDIQLFGSIAGYLAVGAVIYLLVLGRLRSQNHLAEENRIMAGRYFCVIMAEVLYFFVVSVSSAYLAERYMTPVYAVLFLTVFYLVSRWMKKIFADHYLYVMIFLVTIITVNGLKNEEWTYLQQSSESLLNAAAEHEKNDCLFIYDRDWHILPAYYEVSNYRSVTFLREEDLGRLDLMDLSLRDELIVITDGENPAAVERIIGICPLLNDYKFLGGYGNTATYYLYEEETAARAETDRYFAASSLDKDGIVDRVQGK